MAVNLQDEEAIFHAARAIHSPDERHAYLLQACGASLPLRERVEALLKAYEEGEQLVAPLGLGTMSIDPRSLPGERLGTVIDRYKLLEQIGEGGFGVVFMAEQTHPVRRRVALKVVKPGMDTRQVSARFEAERQALAMMDHPNIAKVLDAGATETGRPYFVMELVHGVPITEYCDQNKLAPPERLKLFVVVCRAIQHAHQKGIIHRDLKPTNVLVTLQDGAAVPKVIDFGIAKAMGQELTDKTLFTAFAQMVGTPLYMSPEQAGGGADVDTRSDIYSLGVLLYELLTGTTPFDKERLKQAAYDEIRRIIREEDPPRPSTRLSTIGDAVATVSAQRRTEAKKLGQLVHGELDWIVMRSLEKDRGRRYESASGLARDVERYLADEPVEACPPSRIYRLRKFVRRNRAIVAAGLLLATALLIALGGIAAGVGWAIRDRTEREHLSARQAAERQAKVGAQLEAILDQVRALEQKEKWSEALLAASRAEPALASGDAAPDVAHDVRAALADLQLVRRLEETRAQTGTAWASDYFNRTESELVPAADRAYSTAFRQAGIDIDTLSSGEAAARILSRNAVSAATLPALDDWIALRTGLNNPAGAKPLVAILRRADPDPWRQRVREALVRQDWPTIAALAKSADVDRQPAATLCLFSAALWVRPEAERQLGDERVSLELDLLRRAQSRYPSDFWINHWLGAVLVFQSPDSAPEGIGYLRAAIAVRPDNAHAIMNLGNGYKALHQLDQAITCYRKATELAPDSFACWYDLGSTLEQRRRFGEAIDAWQKALQCDADSTQTMRNLIVCYRLTHQTEKATEWERRKRSLLLPAIQKKLPTTLPADPVQASNQLFLRANLYAQMGDFSKARADLSEALRLHTSQIAQVTLACIELYLGNEQAYKELRVRFLAANTSSTRYKLLVGEVGLLRPLSAEELSKAAKWVEAGLPTTQPASAPSTSPATQPRHATDRAYHSDLARGMLAKGMLDFRRGDFHSAFERLNRCDDEIDQIHHSDPLESLTDLDQVGTTADFYLAMCQERLSQHAEALQQLADACDFLESEFGAGLGGEPGYGSADWLILHIAAREAEATVNPKSPATALAEEDYSKSIETNPSWWGNWYARARLYGRTGATEKAKSDLANAIQRLGDRNVADLNELAWKLATDSEPALRDEKTAVLLAERSVALQPADGQIWNALGVARYRAGDYAKSIEALEKSRGLGDEPYFAGDAFFLAMANWQLSQKAEARKWYDQAVAWMDKHQPKDEELLRFRAEAELLMFGKRPSTLPAPTSRPQTASGPS